MYRRCGSTIKVNDVTIPQCAGICIPILLVHKNPLLWPEPNKFDPERYMYIVHMHTVFMECSAVYTAIIYNQDHVSHRRRQGASNYVERHAFMDI